MLYLPAHLRIKKLTKQPLEWARELEHTASVLDQQGSAESKKVAAANIEIAYCIRLLFTDNQKLLQQVSRLSVKKVT